MYGVSHVTVHTTLSNRILSIAFHMRGIKQTFDNPAHVRYFRTVAVSSSCIGHIAISGDNGPFFSYKRNSKYIEGTKRKRETNS